MHNGQIELIGGAATKWYLHESIKEIREFRASWRFPYTKVKKIQTPQQIALRSHPNGNLGLRKVVCLTLYNFYQNNDAEAHCIVGITGLSSMTKWWYPCCVQCGHEAVPHGALPSGESSYICSTEGCDSKRANLLYHLRVLTTDGSDEAEFSMVGTNAERVIGKTIQQVIENNVPECTSTENLAVSASRIRGFPKEVASVAGKKYRFIVKVTESCFHLRTPLFYVKKATEVVA